MMPPGAALGTVQVQLGTAPLIGQVDPAGRMISLAKLDGWWSPPGSSGTKTQKPAEHGAFLGPAFYKDRVVGLTYNVDGFGAGDSMTVAQAIVRALTLDRLVPLSVTDEAETLTALVRQDGDPIVVRNGNRITASLSLCAPDPRRYAPAVTIPTGLPVQAGGVSLPLVLPLSIGGSSSTGSVTAINTGDIDTNVVFTVIGPCAPFTITDSLGRQLYYDNAVETGHTVVLDGNTKLALQDGTALRTVTGTWPRLLPDPELPGGVNTFYFNATGYDAASKLLVTYRSARR